jgi:hypothetical protein
VLDEQDLPVGEVFIDDGRSAWNPRVVRNDWERLMAMLESGASAEVTVSDMERFTTRDVLAVDLARQFVAERVKVLRAEHAGVLDEDEAQTMVLVEERRILDGFSSRRAQLVPEFGTCGRWMALN